MNSQLAPTNHETTSKIERAKQLAGDLMASGWKPYNDNDLSPLHIDSAFYRICDGLFLTQLRTDANTPRDCVAYEHWWKRVPKANTTGGAGSIGPRLAKI